MWLNIRAELRLTRPYEGTTWFRADLGHWFYTLVWYDTVQKFLGFSGPNPFNTKHDGLWSDWPGPAQFLALRVTIWHPNSSRSD
jgi:hypothetical protein